MKSITSKDNPAIKQALRLRQKKYRLREGSFWLEGRKMVQEGLACPDLLTRIFLDESVAGDYRSTAEEHPGIEWMVLESRLMDLLCETDHPQGIAAIAHIPNHSPELVPDEAELLLLLDQVSDPGNLGTIIRSAWAFAVDAILLTPDCADPFSPKVVRASMGGVLHVPLYPETGYQALVSLQSRGFELLGTSPAAAVSLFDMDFTGRKIIVIGNEAHGMSAEMASLCHDFFKIPVNQGVDSLNAAVACSIITLEACRQRRCGFLF